MTEQVTKKTPSLLIDKISKGLGDSRFDKIASKKLNIILKSGISEKKQEEIISILKSVKNQAPKEKLRIIIKALNIVERYKIEKEAVNSLTKESTKKEKNEQYLSNFISTNKDKRFIKIALRKLEKIDVNKTTPENKTELIKLFAKIRSSKDTNEVLKLSIFALNIFEGRKKEYEKKLAEEKGGETQPSFGRNLGEIGFFEKTQSSIKGMIPSFSKNEFKNIESINIDGSVDSIKEFKAKLEKLIEYIKTTKTYKNLEQEKKEVLITNIESLGKNLEQGKKIGFENIEKLFDGYGRQIDRQGDGQVNLNIGDIIITFASKEKAFKYIKTLKEKAETIFQSNLKNIGEFAGVGLLTILETGLDILTKPFQWVYDDGKDLITNLKYGADGLKWSLDSIIFSISLFMSINYTETLVRRCIIDVAAKMGIKEIPILKEKVLDENGNEVKKDTEVRNKKGDTKTVTKTETKPRRITIPDFSKMAKDQILSGHEASLYNEYLQRIFIIDRLEEMLDEKTGKEKELFKNKFEKVKSLLNVNSKSFYLDAYALKKGLWTPRKYWWALRNGKIAFKFHFGFLPFFAQDLSQQAQTEFNVEKNDLIKKYNKGINLVFNDGEVKDENGKTIINVDVKETNYSENIKKIISYIENNSSITKNEKKERIDRIKEFLKTLDTRPRTRDYIKTKLYNIAEKGEITSDEAKAILEKELKEYIPDENKLGEGKSFKDWLLNLPKKVKQEFFNKFSEIYGKKAPAILTKGQASLIKLTYFTDNGMLEVNKEELNTLIKECKSGKVEFNRLYEGKINKLKFIKDFGVKGFLKIIRGDKIEFTKIKRYASSVLKEEWIKIIEKGQESISEVQKSKETLKEGGPLERLLSIFEYDNLNYNSKKELKFKKITLELKEIIEGGKLTQEQAKLEIVKLYKGYLTTGELLKRINSLSSEVKKTGKAKILIELVEKGDYLVKYDEWETLEKNIIKANKEFVENKSTIDLGNIEKEIKELEKKGKNFYDQRAEKYFETIEKQIDGKNIEIVNFTDIENKEIKLLDILRSLEYKKDSQKLVDLKDSLNSGEKFRFEQLYNKILEAYKMPKINISKTPTRENFISFLKKETADFFEGLNEGKQKKVLNFIKDNNLQQNDILPEILKKALKTEEQKEEQKEEKNKKLINSIEKINKEIRNLRGYPIPNTLNDYDAVRKELLKKGIVLSGSKDLIVDLNNNTDYSKLVKQGINKKIESLQEEKLTLLRETYGGASEIPAEIIEGDPWLKKTIEKLIKRKLQTLKIEETFIKEIKDFEVKNQKEIYQILKEEGITKETVKERVEEIKERATKAK